MGGNNSKPDEETKTEEEPPAAAAMSPLGRRKSSYGAGLDGVTALLAMLASCAAGITVVGIDNGYGAACATARLLGTAPAAVSSSPGSAP